MSKDARSLAIALNPRPRGRTLTRWLYEELRGTIIDAHALADEHIAGRLRRARIPDNLVTPRSTVERVGWRLNVFSGLKPGDPLSHLTFPPGRQAN
jgi:hypothetical protein